MSASPPDPDAAALRADLVLEAGGVKGIALAGAVSAFAAAGYAFPRVAGTSAGAIVAALTAALQRAGEPIDRLADIALTLDYRKVQDRAGLGSVLGHVGLGWVADAIGLGFHTGMFNGSYLRGWLAGVLADLGVRTFADLRLPVDAGTDLPPAHRYRLVVTASDVSRQRLARLPWDYADYGLDPDAQPVAGAVHASAAIPFYFRPVPLAGGQGAGVSTLVDGGLLADYPITIFDRTDGRPPRWPTFGVRLEPRPGRPPAGHPVRDPIGMSVALIETMLNGCEADTNAAPCNAARTVFADTSAFSSLDFGISAAQQRELLAIGVAAAERFLAGWDFPGWLANCRGGPQ